MTLDALIDTFTLKLADISGYVSGAYFVLALGLKLESYLNRPVMPYKDAFQTAREILVLDPMSELLSRRRIY